MGDIKTNAGAGGRILELEDQLENPKQLFRLAASHKYSTYDEGGTIDSEYYKFVKNFSYYKVIECIKEHKVRYLRATATCYGGALNSSSSDVTLSIYESETINVAVGRQFSTSNYGSYTSSSAKAEDRLIGYLV